MTRRTLLIIIVTAILLLAGVGIVLAQGPDANDPAGTQATLGTGFTYQGRLTNNGSTLNTTCDFRFSLWDAGGTSGNQIGTNHTVSNVAVSDGRFTVQVNTGNEFGANAFAGNARWLEVEVNCPNDSSFQRLGRQQLRPAPYAHFAPQAGSAGTADAAPWSGLTGVPSDIADGDDDTTYSAGSGLNLSGTTFNVDTSTLQTRVDESCVVGSTIRSINADGSVECTPDAPLNRNQAPAGTVTTTVNTDGWAGADSAVTIGSDGLPVIAEHDGINRDLRVAHCDDLDCATATVTTIDSAGDVGDELAITLGTDGLPLISYHDATNNDLKVAHCNNLACTDAVTTTLDSSSDVGRWTSITIGEDGLGLISYHDEGNGALKVAHCANVTCTSATHTTAVDNGGGTDDVGEYTSIALGADGRGLISYYDRSNGDLKIAQCGNAICSVVAAATAVSTDDVGLYTSITVGSDGLGLVAYWNNSNGLLTVAHCNTTSCSSPSVAPILGIGSATNDAISIAVGADDLPVISYYDAAAGALNVAHCTNRFCDNAVINTVDESSSNTGQNTSITIGVDGHPFVTYFDQSNKQLMAAHCSNPFCTPSFRRR